MTSRVQQAQIGSGAIRDRPIVPELEAILDQAARAAGVDRVVVGSGGQPGTTGKRKGSTRHDGGRAADFKLYQGGKVLAFTDAAAPPAVIRFITECARLGANGIGASVLYMGPETFHVGFGLTPADRNRVVWGGAAANSAGAPKWLRDACTVGWSGPAAAPMPRPKPAPAAPSRPAPQPSPAGPIATGIGGSGAAILTGGVTTGNATVIWVGAIVLVAAIVGFLIARARRR